MRSTLEVRLLELIESKTFAVSPSPFRAGRPSAPCGPPPPSLTYTLSSLMKKEAYDFLSHNLTTSLLLMCIMRLSPWPAIDVFGNKECF